MEYTECVKCNKNIRKKNITKLCWACFLASNKKREYSIASALKRDYNGSSNPNYKGSVMTFKCKCGTFFRTHTSPSRIRTQGNPRFCSVKCKHKFSVSKTKRINYNGDIFRSSWEVSLAKHFVESNIAYIYEPISFETPYGFYLPDFYIPLTDQYFEVKGFFRDENSRLKFNFFKLQHNCILADLTYFKSIGYKRISTGPKKGQLEKI